MKKMFLYLCVGAAVLSLSACGKAGREEGSSQEQGSESGSQEQPGAGDESTQEGTGDDSQEGIGDDGQSGAGDGSLEDGQVPETPEGWSEEMQGMRDAVVEALGQENYWPDMPVDAQMLEMFYGITSDMYEDYMAETPMISANVDALVIIRAADDKADGVEEALKAYREANVNDTMQYPQNVGKIQASQVERIGSYVVFVQLGGFAIEAESEEEVIAQCQEANSLALDTIREKIEGSAGN